MIPIHVQCSVLTSRGYYPVSLLKKGTPVVIYDKGFKTIPLDFDVGSSVFHRTRLHREDQVKWNGKWVPGGGFNQWLSLNKDYTVYVGKSGFVPLTDLPRDLPIFDIRMLGIKQTHNLDYCNEDQAVLNCKRNRDIALTKARYQEYEVEKLSRIYESDIYKYKRGRISIEEFANPTEKPCMLIKAPNIITTDLIIGEIK